MDCDLQFLWTGVKCLVEAFKGLTVLLYLFRSSVAVFMITTRST